MDQSLPNRAISLFGKQNQITGQLSKYTNVVKGMQIGRKSCDTISMQFINMLIYLIKKSIYLMVCCWLDANTNENNKMLGWACQVGNIDGLR